MTTVPNPYREYLAFVEGTSVGDRPLLNTLLLGTVVGQMLKDQSHTPADIRQTVTQVLLDHARRTKILAANQEDGNNG